LESAVYRVDLTAVTTAVTAVTATRPPCSDKISFTLLSFTSKSTKELRAVKKF
jgi:hypothetical protein